MRRIIQFSLWIAAGVGLATTLQAQNVSVGSLPTYQVVDDIGVDRVSGNLTISSTDLQIDSDDGPMQLRRSFVLGAWRHNFLMTLSAQPAVMTVQIGGVASKYGSVSGMWIPWNGDGSFMTSAYPLYTLTTANGTKIIFDATKMDNGSDLQIVAVATKMILPSGEALDLAYTTPTCSSPPCSVFYYRLSSVRSTRGYQFFFEYASNVMTSAQVNADKFNWYRVTRVRALNNTSETCLPGSVSCTPSGTWKTVNYAYQDLGGGNALYTTTDSLNRVTRFTTYFNRLIGYRRPASAADDITATLDVSTGKVATITRDGATYNYTYGTGTTTRANSLGQQQVFTYDTANGAVNGRPLSSKDELNRITSFQHDSYGRVTRATHPEGDYFQYTLDGRGNATQTQYVPKAGSGLATLTSSAAFPATCSNPLTCNKPTSTTDARGAVTDYTYDPNHGGVLTITRPAPTTGAVRPQTRYTYTALYARYKNDAGQLVQAPTPVYQLTSVSACQSLVSCIGTADESTKIFDYGSPAVANNLLPVSVTMRSGDSLLSATSTMTYDLNGETLTIDGPLAGTADTTKLQYDVIGEAIGAVTPDPDGGGPLKNRAQRLSYNANGQIAKVELGTVNSQSDADWALFAPLQTIDLTYDSHAKLSTSKLSAGGADYSLTQTSYDALGRLDCTAVRLNTAIYGSLPSSACTQGTQGSFGPDRISQNLYDAAGQVTQMKVGVGTADAASERTLTYTTNGKLATLLDAENNLTTYEYDGFDRLSKTRYPNTAKGSGTSSTTDYEQRTYDANSNVTQVRARSGGLIGYSYDFLNRRLSKNSSSLADVAYTYDLLDRPLTIKFSTSGQGITNGYDALGRLLSTTTDVGGTARTMSHLYDLAGRRTRSSWWDGFFIDYDRLVTGELSKIRENGVTSGVGVLEMFGYDDLGQRTSMTGGNGTATSWGYDPVARLTSFSQDLAGTTYDLTMTNSFSPASQIVTQTRSNDAYSFTGSYNVARTYASNGLNQHTSAGTTSFGYDSNGNLTSDGTNTFTYDIENKLTSTTSPTVSTSLSYDPLNRLDVYNPGSPLRFIYDGAEVVAEVDGTGDMKHRYVRGDGADELFVVYSNASPTSHRWVHSDERGSVIAQTDETGALQAINRYDEYGVPQSTNSGFFQYTGQMWLSEAGLYNYKNRIYSTTLGRFLQTDPIGPADDANLYAYVQNDPVNSVDSAGLLAGCSQASGWCGGEGSVTDGIKDAVQPDIIITAKNPINWSAISLLSGITGSQPSSEALFHYAGLPGFQINLVQQEALGGHTIVEHVGKSQAYLLARIRASQIDLILVKLGLRRAGSFTSLQAATRLINATLSSNWPIVQEVASGRLSSAFITRDFASPTGYEAYTTGSSDPYIRTTYGVGVLIIHDPQAPGDFRVQTGYPRNP